MGKLTVLALHVVLAMVVAGSLFVQGVLVLDLADVPWQLAIFVGLGLLAVEVCAVCVWRLLTMVRRGTVFSTAAFRYVDVIFGALVAASLLTFLLAVALAPGEAPPGIVLMICGASLVVAGMALIVLVLRMLLAQAVALDEQAHTLQAELAEVI